MTNNDVVTFIMQKMEKNRITQKRLAKNTGTTEAAISRYLNNLRYMPFSVMTKCLDYLGYEFTIRRKDDE